MKGFNFGRGFFRKNFKVLIQQRSAMVTLCCMLKDQGGGFRLNHPCGNILYFVIAITLGMWVSVHAICLNRLELNTLLFQQTMQTKFAF